MTENCTLYQKCGNCGVGCVGQNGGVDWELSQKDKHVMKCLTSQVK